MRAPWRIHYALRSCSARPQIAGGARPVEFRPVVLSGFSAGYGIIRKILQNRANRQHVDAVVLADGSHTSYVPEGKPGPLQTENLEAFLDFARQPVAGRKQMLLTHLEIFPGTFASTTETTDFLIERLQLKRQAVLAWGPLGMQQLSRVRAGRFEVLDFAGNTAPDHIDHLHALEYWLKRIKL